MAIAALNNTLLAACRSFVVLPADWSKRLGGSGEAHGFLTPYAQLRAVHSPARGSETSVGGALAVSKNALGLDAILELVKRTAGGFVDADAPLMVLANMSRVIIVHIFILIS